jgi:PhnB protein
MPGSVKPIPDGYHSVTPYLIVKNAGKAIEFYKKAFGATEILRMCNGDQVCHAELKIGDSPIMLADECKDMGALSPETIGNSPITIMLYVENVDALFNQAISAGATVLRPVADQFYGDRTGGVLDPFGHKWYIATHIEDVPHDELERRSEAARKEHAKVGG